MIHEPVAMTEEFRAMANRGDEMNLTGDELAFYDALATNGSAIDLTGDPQIDSTRACHHAAQLNHC